MHLFHHSTVRVMNPRVSGQCLYTHLIQYTSKHANLHDEIEAFTILQTSITYANFQS